MSTLTQEVSAFCMIHSCTPSVTSCRDPPLSSTYLGGNHHSVVVSNGLYHRNLGHAGHAGHLVKNRVFWAHDSHLNHLHANFRKKHGKKSGFTVSSIGGDFWVVSISTNGGEKSVYIIKLDFKGT